MQIAVLNRFSWNSHDWCASTHRWTLPIVFGYNRPNRTKNMGENAPETNFSGLSQIVWVFLRKQLKYGVRYSTSRRKNFIHFCRPTPCPFKNGHAPKNYSYGYFGKYYFFWKIFKRRIFKIPSPTKKVILIFVTKRHPSLKTACPPANGFSKFFLKLPGFFEKLVQ